MFCGDEDKLSGKVEYELNGNNFYRFSDNNKYPSVQYYMIETPRVALLAGEIAEEAEFFSFGANDLTQMTYGLSAYF